MKTFCKKTFKTRYTDKSDATKVVESASLRLAHIPEIGRTFLFIDTVHKYENGHEPSESASLSLNSKREADRLIKILQQMRKTLP